MRCPGCSHEPPPDAAFCPRCGTALERLCAHCGTSNAPDHAFCKRCGGPLEKGAPAPAPAAFASPRAYTPRHLAERILTARSALEGEHKQVTVLFCDITSSTALAERLGPEAMHALLNRFFELSLAEVHRYEGTVNQFLGDGFMALFGAPLAHEDHARRAVLAAVAIQRALREAGGEVDVRMGVNTGAVVVGSIGDNLRMDYTAIGDTTNLAARLQQLAAPGAVVLSEATYRAVRDLARVEDLGPVTVKGRTEPVRAYRLVGVGPSRAPFEDRADRPLSHFVGRQRELGTLHELLSQVEQGQGQIVGLVGDPGVGKSRLLHEFRQSLRGRNVTYLEGHCLSWGSTVPYLPILDIVRANCGIGEADTPETVTDKVRVALLELRMDAEVAAPYVLHLIGVKAGTESLEPLTAQALKERTFETLRQMSVRGSRVRPLIFGVEDVHWMDSTSEEYLGSLVERLAGVPILLVTTYRPGYRPPWIAKSYATQVALRPLSREDGLAVVGSLVRGRAASETVARAVLDKAEGNPFFIEELTRTLLDHPDLGAQKVPATVQDVLAARMDRLPEDARRLLQTASVLGREVPSRLLGLVWGDDTTLEPLLGELRRFEFLYERSGLEDRVLVFKHALTQEVAYETLLAARRQALHAAATGALETIYAGRLEDACDRLAHHAARAEDAGKAVAYLLMVAERAARNYANAEAASIFRQAREHSERLPQPERDRSVFDLLWGEGLALFYLGRRREAVDLLSQFEDRLERLGDPLRAARFYWALGVDHSFLGDREHAGACLMRAIAAAREAGDDQTLGRCLMIAALERMWVGRLREGIELGRQAVALLEGVADTEHLANAYWMVGWVRLFLGEFEAARDELGRFHALGETTGDPRIQCNAGGMLGLLDATVGDPLKAIAMCRRAVERAPAPYDQALALGWLGYAHLEHGDRSEAVDVLERADRMAGEYRSLQVQALFKAYLGDAYLAAGRLDDAQALSSRSREIAGEVGYPYGTALATRTLGRIAHARGSAGTARALLGEARESFAAMEMPLELARTFLDLAAAAHAEGDATPTESWLREAHALFSSLSASRDVARTEELARAVGVTLPQFPSPA